MYITKKKCSYFGPFEREQALDENFSMFVFFLSKFTMCDRYAIEGGSGFVWSGGLWCLSLRL
jgi:hypothetical protein